MSKAAPPSKYRDDPDAVSMHTTPSDYDYDDAPELPSYSDSEAAVVSTYDPVNNISETEILTDAYPVVHGPEGWRRGGKVSTGNETTIRMDKSLTDPEELYGYIMNYLRAVPPRPKLRIHGHHTETVYQKDKKEKKNVTDFDFFFDFSEYLPNARSGADGGWQPRVASNSDKTHRGGWRTTRAPGYSQDIEVGAGASEMDLREWCREYCDSKATLKIFRISREVPGLDQEFLRTGLERMIRSTNYRGHVNITFPIDDKHVDIYSPHWVNQWRISWVRWIFYLTFLFIFTWPLLFFMTKRWAVYRVDWCFSWYAPDGIGGSSTKRYARMSEQTWFEKHANMVRGLAVDRFQGDATGLPLNAGFTDERRRREGTGNADVDTAINIVQGGLSIWNQVSRGGRRQTDGWGADS